MDSKIRRLASANKVDEDKAKDNEVVDSIIQSDLDAPSVSQELIPGITPEELQEFKNQVKTWLDLDVVIKRLQIAIKERKKIQVVLNEKILKFMILHSIEDLNTKSGTIRYKSSKVKAPLSQKSIKMKLTETFDGNTKIIEKINKVFDDRETKEKQTLRKLKF